MTQIEFTPIKNTDLYEKHLLVHYNDPILSTPTQPFNFENPPIDPEDLAELLVDKMKRHGGVGIAANQIGIPYSVFAVVSDMMYVCFNPRIVGVSEATEIAEEGCLSYPNLSIKIKRPIKIRIRFQGPDGETYTKEFSGKTARIIQHEIMHLEGKKFFEGVSRAKLDLAMRKAKIKWEIKK